MRIIKQNIVLIISFLVLLIVLINSSNNWFKNEKQLKENMSNYSAMCQNEEKFNSLPESGKEYCLNIIKNGYEELGFYSTLFEIKEGLNKISLLLPIFIVIPSLVYICKYMKSKELLLEVTRTDYKKSVLNFLRKSYKSTFIVFGIILISFIIARIHTGSFDASHYLKSEIKIWDATLVTKPFIFMALYLINILMISILYINVALCIARKYYNYFVASILSFLTIYGIDIILEVGIGAILFGHILNNKYFLIFNIINMINFDTSNGVFNLLLFSFIMMIASFLAVWISYKNKEKLIIDLERYE